MLWSWMLLMAVIQPERALTQYVCDIWNLEEGLPQSSVQCLTQTRDGFIWFGTQEGLLRFDGVRFDIFTRTNTALFRSNYISMLYEDRDGRLWIGADQGGLLVYDKGRFQDKSADLKIGDDVINHMFQDRKGRLWVSTFESGLRVYDGKQVRQISTEQGLSHHTVWQVLEDDDGFVWVTTAEGLNRIKDDHIEVFTEKDGLCDNRCWSLAMDERRRLWIGTRSGLNFFSGGKLETYARNVDLPEKRVVALYADRQGFLWAGTYNRGLVRFNDDRFEIFDEQNGLPYNNILCFREDVLGAMWVGTDGGGLVRLRPGPITAFTTAEGLANDMVRALVADESGLWIATDGGGLAHFADGRFRTYGREAGFVDLRLLSISPDRKGGFWIGGQGGGLHHFYQGKVRHWGLQDGLPTETVRSIYQDRAGVVWLATSKGLVRFQDGSFKTFTTENGLSSNLVVSFLEDSDGVLWIATRGGGLNYLKDGQFHAFTTQDGLSSNNLLGLYQGSGNRIWIGTSDGGLNLFENGAFFSFSIRDGFFDDNIIELLQGNQEDFWIGTNRGIFRVFIQDLLAFRDGTLDRIPYRSWNSQDGMKSAECNGGTYPAAAKTQDGWLWFPTIKGFVGIDPAKVAPSEPIIPNVLLTRIAVNGRTLVPNERGLNLPADTRGLEIQYTALGARVPERVQFRYRLVGQAGGWISAGQRRTAFFTNLGPGNYRFQVSASVDGNAWSAEDPGLVFVVRPYFYQLWWFQALGGLAIVVLAFLAHRWRLLLIKKNARILEEQVKKRTLTLEETNRRLAQAQEQVVEAAHRAGMVEMAHQVLSQVETSIDQVSETIEGTRALTAEPPFTLRLEPIVTELAANRSKLPELIDHGTDGGRLKNSLVGTLVGYREGYNRLAEQTDLLKQEMIRILANIRDQQDNAKREFFSHEVDVNLLITEALELKQALFDFFQIKVLRKLSPIPSCRLQRARLLRVLVSLIQYCCEAMEAVPEDLRRLEVASQKRDKSILITVTDSGPGLEPQEQGKFFAQEFSENNRWSFVLHTCATAVSEMDGQIQVKSEGAGKGLHFRLELPFVPANQTRPL